MPFRRYAHGRLVLMIGLLLVTTLWLAQTQAGSRVPLPWGEGTELSQRVLTLPGARLMQGPATPPLWSIFTVQLDMDNPLPIPSGETGEENLLRT